MVKCTGTQGPRGPIQLLKWWDNRKKRYPFRCKTSGTKFPRPEVFDKITKGAISYIRIPLGKTAYWAFATEAERHTFKSLYVAEDMEDICET